MPLVKRENSIKEIDSVIEQSTIAQLGDPDPAVRRLAAQSLGATAENVAQLIEALKLETSLSVRESMFTALMKIGNEDVATSLIELLYLDEPFLRNGAIEALKTMPALALERVPELLYGPRDVRIFAAEILGALPIAGVLEYLLEWLESESEVIVCGAIVEAIMECFDDTAIEPLHNVLHRFPDEVYLEFAVRAALARNQHV